jgi:UMF1 family MFS transporter
MSHTSGSQKADSPALKLSTQISAKGVGIGYMAAVSSNFQDIDPLFDV